jgi:hypothetical protein
MATILHKRVPDRFDNYCPLLPGYRRMFEALHLPGTPAQVALRPPIPFPGPGHVETESKELGNPHLREDEGRRQVNPVVRVVQFRGGSENLSDCGAAPYLRFFLVRNEEAGGSNPLSSTRF